MWYVHPKSSIDTSNTCRIGEEGNDCSFAFDEAHLFEKVRDLEQKGQEPRKSAGHDSVGLLKSQKP